MPFNARPIDYTYAFPAEEVRAVLEQYELGRWEVVDEVRQGPKTLRSGIGQGTARKVYLATDAGMLLLKQLPWYCRDERGVAAMTAVVVRLREDGWPVPSFFPTRNGSRYHCRGTAETPAFYVLQGLIEGHPWSGESSQLIATGRLLGGLHAHAVSLSLTDLRCEDLPREDLFVNTRAAITTVEARCPRAGSVCDRLRQYLDDLATMAGRAGYGEERSIVHGDYNQTNLLFDGEGRVVALLDFDNLSLDHPSIDVACAVMHISAMEIDIATQRYAAKPTRFDRATAAQFLDAYASQASRAELVARVLEPVMGAWALMLGVLGILNGVWTPDNGDDLLRFADLVQENCRQVARF